MGLTKRRLEEEREGQYLTPIGRYVCHRCVTDSFLKEFLQSSTDTEQLCSYCCLTGATDISVLLTEISDVIKDDYTDPANGLPYESQSGGYQGEVYNGEEVLEELGSWTDNEELYADVEKAFSNGQWCSRYYLGLDQYDKYWLGWMEFTEIVKHRTRYLFFGDSEGEISDEIVLPSRVLSTLGKLFQEFDWFTNLKKGTKLVRVRVVKADNNPSTAKELGAPPPNLATQNRMSPAGIPMFYGSFDDLTSVRETYNPNMPRDYTSYQPHENRTKKLVLATFEAVKDLRMLDLGRDMDLPSCFDVERRWQRKVFRFLQDFVIDFSKPIDRDGQEHFEYAPTQVVIEYVRHRLLDNRGRKVDGVLYPSAANPGKQAAVVFAGPEHCGAVQDPFNDAQTVLRLVRYRDAAPDEFK